MSARWIVRAGRTVLAWRRRGQDSRLPPGRAECRNGSTPNSGRSSHMKRDAFSTSPLQEKTAGDLLSDPVGGGCPPRHSAWAQIARGSHSEYLWSLCAFSEKKRPEKQLHRPLCLPCFFADSRLTLTLQDLLRRDLSLMDTIADADALIRTADQMQSGMDREHTVEEGDPV
jgi:hypothetical protein